MENIITYIQVALFLAYVVYIWNRFGVLISISASSYALQGNERYIFTGWLYALGILSLFQPLSFYGGIMAMGLATAGITIDHRRDETLEDEWHTYGTIVAIVSGFAGLYLLYSIWIPMLVFVGVGGGLYLWANNKTWWIEILAILMIAWGLLKI